MGCLSSRPIPTETETEYISLPTQSIKYEIMVKGDKKSRTKFVYKIELFVEALSLFKEHHGEDMKYSNNIVEFETETLYFMFIHLFHIMENRQFAAKYLDSS